jgi:hypothetical protein
MAGERDAGQAERLHEVSETAGNRLFIEAAFRL